MVCLILLKSEALIVNIRWRQVLHQLIVTAMKRDVKSNGNGEMFGGLFTKVDFPKPGDLPLLNRKVFRGTRVTIREHPYVASVRRLYSHYLTGTLLTKNIVITVAHPVYMVPVTELNVVVGQNYNDRGAGLSTVLLVLIHGDFNPYSLKADIALLRIYEDFVYKVSVKPIALALADQIIDGRTAFVTGWGRCDRTGKELCLPRSSRFYRGEIMDPMLMSIKFTVDIKNEFCRAYYDELLDNRSLCVGDLRQKNPLAPCMAVPGAPMVVDARLVGLQSWGFGCGYSNDLPLVYTNIQHYLRWIHHNVHVLNSISKQSLTEIFEATKAQILVQWLVQTRMTVPVMRLPPLEDIVPLASDNSLAMLRGRTYDVRDFLFEGKYRQAKVNAYVAIRGQMKAKETKKMKPKLVQPVRGLPFLNAIHLNDTGLSLVNGSLIEAFDDTSNDEAMTTSTSDTDHITERNVTNEQDSD